MSALAFVEKAGGVAARERGGDGLVEDDDESEGNCKSEGSCKDEGYGVNERRVSCEGWGWG